MGVAVRVSFLRESMRTEGMVCRRTGYFEEQGLPVGIQEHLE